MKTETIPTRNGWGDLADMDAAKAYKYFGGKTNSEMQEEFERNIDERCINLDWMPIGPFLYYINGLKDHIEAGNFGMFSKARSADWFFNLILRKSKDHPGEVKSIIGELIPTLKKISDDQLVYDLDQDIYGDFNKRLQAIYEALELTA